MRKIATKRELVEAIRAALDCQNHFDNIKIVNKDSAGFSLGKNPMVCCDQCVERMRRAIGVRQDEENLTAFAYENNG